MPGIRTYTFIYFQGKFLPTRLLEYLCLLILAEIPNYKIILSSFKLLFCCFKHFKVTSKLKFSSHKILFKQNWRLFSETNPTYTFILFWTFFLPTRLIQNGLDSYVFHDLSYFTEVNRILAMLS